MEYLSMDRSVSNILILHVYVLKMSIINLSD